MAGDSRGGRPACVTIAHLQEDRYRLIYRGDSGLAVAPTTILFGSINEPGLINFDVSGTVAGNVLTGTSPLGNADAAGNPLADRLAESTDIPAEDTADGLTPEHMQTIGFDLLVDADTNNIDLIATLSSEAGLAQA